MNWKKNNTIKKSIEWFDLVLFFSGCSILLQDEDRITNEGMNGTSTHLDRLDKQRYQNQLQLINDQVCWTSVHRAYDYGSLRGSLGTYGLTQRKIVLKKKLLNRKRKVQSRLIREDSGRTHTWVRFKLMTWNSGKFDLCKTVSKSSLERNTT